MTTKTKSSGRPMSETWGMGIAPVPAPSPVRLLIAAAVPASWALIVHLAPAAWALLASL